MPSRPDSPSACWIFVVERLVDDAHHGLACAPQVHPDQDQSAVEARGEEVALLQHLLPPLDVLAGGVLARNKKKGARGRGHLGRALKKPARVGSNGRLPMGSIQMPRSEGLRGTVRASVWASMLTGSWWMARASRDAAVWLLSSTDASSEAVSASELHTVTVTLSPGDTFEDCSAFSAVNFRRERCTPGDQDVGRTSENTPPC